MNSLNSKEPRTATRVIKTNMLDAGKTMSKCESVGSQRIPKSGEVRGDGTNDGYQAQEVSIQPLTKLELEEKDPILEINSFIEKEETSILEAEQNVEYQKFKELFQEKYFGKP